MCGWAHRRSGYVKYGRFWDTTLFSLEKGWWFFNLINLSFQWPRYSSWPAVSVMSRVYSRPSTSICLQYESSMVGSYLITHGMCESWPVRRNTVILVGSVWRKDIDTYSSWNLFQVLEDRVEDIMIILVVPSMFGYDNPKWCMNKKKQGERAKEQLYWSRRNRRVMADLPTAPSPTTTIENLGVPAKWCWWFTIALLCVCVCGLLYVCCALGWEYVFKWPLVRSTGLRVVIFLLFFDTFRQHSSKRNPPFLSEFTAKEGSRS